MNVTKLEDAQQYYPPNHTSMACLRLQGHEAGPADDLWLGMSILLPGGGTSLDASAVEKHYVVVDGEVVIKTEHGHEVLRKFDSCRIAPGEKRALFNATNKAATIILAMPFAKSTGANKQT